MPIAHSHTSRVMATVLPPSAALPKRTKAGCSLVEVLKSSISMVVLSLLSLVKVAFPVTPDPFTEAKL